jgi:hypothetical protein
MEIRYGNTTEWVRQGTVSTSWVLTSCLQIQIRVQNLTPTFMVAAYSGACLLSCLTRYFPLALPYGNCS